MSLHSALIIVQNSLREHGGSSWKGCIPSLPNATFSVISSSSRTPSNKMPVLPTACSSNPGWFLGFVMSLFLVGQVPTYPHLLDFVPITHCQKSPIHFVKVSSSQNPHDISGLVAETPSWLSSGSLWHPYWLLIFVPWYSQSVLWSAPCQPNLGYQLMINDVSSLFFKLLKIV